MSDVCNFLKALPVAGAIVTPFINDHLTRQRESEAKLNKEVESAAKIYIDQVNILNVSSSRDDDYYDDIDPSQIASG